MSTTLQQLEQKLNVKQVVRDNPWPALALAVGAGVLLSRSRSDVKTTPATVAATRGSSSKVGSVLDYIVASFVGGMHDAVESRVIGLVHDLKSSIGVPSAQRSDAARSTDNNPPRTTAPGTADTLDGGGRRSTSAGTVGLQATRAD